MPNELLLLRLAALVEAKATTSKGVYFDMDTWGSINPSALPWWLVPTRWFSWDNPSVRICGLGIAALSGEFVGLSWRHEGGPVFIDENGNQWSGFEAAEKLFNISSADATDLFFSDGYPVKGPGGAKYFVHRIREYVQNHKST